VSVIRSTEIVQQDNCGGTADVENMISKSVTFSSDFAFTVGVTVDARGNATILGTGVELGAAVATELGTSYGKSETEERSVTVRAPPHSRMEHTIAQVELRKEGIARVTLGDRSQDVPFGFRYGVQLTLDESRSLPCSTPTTPSATPTGPATATPTSVPTATATTNAKPTLVSRPFK
jgi:hypothetical protein